MAEVLSQNEIDDLLKALDSGAIDVAEVEKSGEKKTRLYDFKRPNKFGKEQIRTLHSIHEHFSRLLSTFLAGTLRANCEVELVSVEEQIFYEFNNSLPDPVFLAVIDMAPLEGSFLMEISTPIAYGLIDRILGGAGLASGNTREFTEIELALLERLTSHILRLFRDAWDAFLPVSPSLNRIETNPRYIQFLAPNETIAIVTLMVRMGAVDGFINVCIPHLSIKAIEAKLSNRARFTNTVTTKEGDGSSHTIVQRIKDSTVEVRALLGQTTLTAGDVMELQSGDVIGLSGSIHDPIRIQIGEIVRFHGIPGVLNNKLAIRIVGIHEEDEENE